MLLDLWDQIPEWERLSCFFLSSGLSLLEWWLLIHLDKNFKNKNPLPYHQLGEDIIIIGSDRIPRKYLIIIIKVSIRRRRLIPIVWDVLL